MFKEAAPETVTKKELKNSEKKMTQSNGEVTYIIQKEYRENNSWHFKKYEVLVKENPAQKVLSEDASINDIVKYNCITVINLYNLFKLLS